MRKVSLIISEIDDVIPYHKDSIIVTDFIHEHLIRNDTELKKVIDGLTQKIIKQTSNN
jgi:hypothetical protein